MMPHPQEPEGVVWLTSVCVVHDESGKERMVAHYTRRKSLAEELEHGLCVFQDDRQIFESVRTLPLEERWRHPAGHPIPYRDDAGTEWLIFGSPSPNVRVRATLADVLDPTKYEAYTCRSDADESSPPAVDEEGFPHWRWQADLPPVSSEQEAEWVRRGELNPERTRFYPAATGAPETHVQLHSGTVRWNAFRNRWVLIACQLHGDSSLLGEIWYSEAVHPTGPFEQAVKVATHDRQSLYNVCHHEFLDADDGRTIYFEGTYTNSFSGNPHQTPRYNYNQILYRLAIDPPLLGPSE
jgi:hypothetical protein